MGWQGWGEKGCFMVLLIGRRVIMDYKRTTWFVDCPLRAAQVNSFAAIYCNSAFKPSRQYITL
jgi:hypothetical protein